MIHAYDNPVLADRALRAVRGYGKLAPDVAHALHMPSHIFVRVGSWQETIDWNVRSADSAKRHSTEGFMKQGYAHAVDYRVYVHMQKDEYAAAQKIIAQALAVPKHQNVFGVAYGLTAAQARNVLERDAWAAAAALPVRTPAYLSWKKFAQVEAISHFARGIGAARSGDAGCRTACS